MRDVAGAVKHDKNSQIRAGRFLDEMDTLRGHGDRTVFKQLFLQILMLKCVHSAHAPAKSGLSSHPANFPIKSYSDVSAGLAQMNRAQYPYAQFPYDGTCFEPLTRLTFGSETVCELSDGIDSFASNEPQSLLALFDHALRWFARSEGRVGAESVTPEPVAQLLVELAAPVQGTLLDPCCGCAGLLVRAHRQAKAKNQDATLRLYGQESDEGVRKLALINLAANGITADLGDRATDSFVYDHFPAMKSDYVIANPPFNAAIRSSDDLDAPPSDSEAMPEAYDENFAWIQHFIRHLSATGLAVCTAPNSTLASNVRGKGKIRENIVRADLVDCIIALPKRLFGQSGISACVWVLSKDKSGTSANSNGPALRARTGETLFIDAQQTAPTLNRGEGTLSGADITRIVQTYHAWKGVKTKSKYADVPNFCRAARMDEIIAQGFALTPGRYVETPRVATEKLGESIKLFKNKLNEQLKSAVQLDSIIAARLHEFSHEW